MKLIIRAIVTTCIAGVIFLTIMAVSGRMNRSMELKSNLPSTVEETAEKALTKKEHVKCEKGPVGKDRRSRWWPTH